MNRNLNNYVGETIDLNRIENCSCTASFTETGTGIIYDFDLRDLSIDGGYSLRRDDLSWNISFNFCGSNTLYCADNTGAAQYISRSPVIQYFDDTVPPGSTCNFYDPPYGLVPCTNRCIPLAIPDTLSMVPQSMNNVGTGGLRITWTPAYDSPQDPYTCPFDPNRNNLPFLRYVTINLACNLNGTVNAINFTGSVDEPTACSYVISGSSKAACGVTPPSPSPTPSVTASPSSTSSPTGTSTGSGTPTSSSTVTVSSTPLLIDGIFSPLDRDVGIGALGSVVGIVMFILCLFIAYRNLCPWQWNWRRVPSSSAYNYRPGDYNDPFGGSNGGGSSTTTANLFPDYGYNSSSGSNNAAYNVRRDKPNRSDYGTIGSGYQ